MCPLAINREREGEGWTEISHTHSIRDHQTLGNAVKSRIFIVLLLLFLFQSLLTTRIITRSNLVLVTQAVHNPSIDPRRGHIEQRTTLALPYHQMVRETKKCMGNRFARMQAKQLLRISSPLSRSTLFAQKNKFDFGPRKNRHIRYYVHAQDINKCIDFLGTDTGNYPRFVELTNQPSKAGLICRYTIIHRGKWWLLFSSHYVPLLKSFLCVI